MTIKKAKPVIEKEGDKWFIYGGIIAERESVLDAFSFLRSNWGTTKGYEKLKEYMSDIELKEAKQ